MSALDVHVDVRAWSDGLGVTLVGLLAQTPAPRRVVVDAAEVTAEARAVLRLLQARGVRTEQDASGGDDDGARYLLLVDAGVTLGRDVVAQLLAILTESGAGSVTAAEGCTLVDRAAASHADARFERIAGVHRPPAAIAEVA